MHYPPCCCARPSCRSHKFYKLPFVIRPLNRLVVWSFSRFTPSNMLWVDFLKRGLLQGPFPTSALGVIARIGTLIDSIITNLHSTATVVHRYWMQLFEVTSLSRGYALPYCFSRALLRLHSSRDFRYRGMCRLHYSTCRCLRFAASDRCRFFYQRVFPLSVRRSMSCWVFWLSIRPHETRWSQRFLWWSVCGQFSCGCRASFRPVRLTAPCSDWCLLLFVFFGTCSHSAFATRRTLGIYRRGYQLSIGWSCVRLWLPYWRLEHSCFNGRNIR